MWRYPNSNRRPWLFAPAQTGLDAEERVEVVTGETQCGSGGPLVRGGEGKERFLPSEWDRRRSGGSFL